MGHIVHMTITYDFNLTMQSQLKAEIRQIGVNFSLLTHVILYTSSTFILEPQQT